jgi:hypothetical protein
MPVQTRVTLIYVIARLAVKLYRSSESGRFEVYVQALASYHPHFHQRGWPVLPVIWFRSKAPYLGSSAAG